MPFSASSRESRLLLPARWLCDKIAMMRGLFARLRNTNSERRRGRGDLRQGNHQRIARGWVLNRPGGQARARLPAPIARTRCEKCKSLLDGTRRMASQACRNWLDRIIRPVLEKHDHFAESSENRKGLSIEAAVGTEVARQQPWNCRPCKPHAEDSSIYSVRVIYCAILLSFAPFAHGLGCCHV